MGKGKRNKARRRQQRADTPHVTFAEAPDLKGLDLSYVSFHCQGCGLWWSQPSPVQHVIADGAVAEFSVSSRCDQCGTAVTSSVSTTRTLPDGRVVVSPAAGDLPQVTLNPRQPLTVRRGASACAFCGTPVTRVNDSKEHVLGRWLRKVDAIRENFRIEDGAGGWRFTLDHPRASPDRSAILISPPRRLGSKPQHSLFATVKICKHCNTGWMSDLEERVKPVLVPLINGTSTVIAAQDRRLLAQWATKTAIALEQDDPPTICLSGPQVRDVREGRPARWCTVWAARWITPEDVLLRHDVSEAWDKATMKVSWRWGRTWIGLGEGIALQVLGATSPLTPRNQIVPDSPWVQIWPGESADVELTEAATRDLLHKEADPTR